jgi:orotate phosphoribosyltransferase
LKVNEKDLLQIEFKADPSEKEILDIFAACDAAWVHDGDPKKPHAELTSGLCSNAFFDCLRVLKFPNLSQILASALAGKISESIDEPVDWVIGSSYAAITFSYEVANFLFAVHGFTEKDPAIPKKMLWPRLKIPEGSNVLQIEELITTFGTVNEVRQAVEAGNGTSVNFLPVVGTIVHRPPKLPADYGARRVISLIEKEVWAVEQKDCPLCKAGSLRYRAKTHWAELTGKK